MGKFAESASDDSPIKPGHAFAETRAMNVRDQQIRAAGFTIHARPKRGEAVWADRNGALWGQAEVMAKLNRE